MSRTNPLKKKRRQANKTLLVFGEGMGEEMFLKHLKKLYCCNTGVAITIKRGKGGDAVNIIIDADKIPGDFDRRVVVFDNDKPKDEMNSARTEAKKRNIEIIENTPCLESLLLLILGVTPDKKKSAECKKYFETNYIEKSKRNEPREYEKLFPKKFLEEKRKSIKELNIIIEIMEGK